MTFGIPGMVVVDDDVGELESIQKAFFEAALPCLPIKYIGDDPDNESGIDHVDLSEEVTPRIVVSDLNLTESQNAKPSSLVGPLAKVLEKLSVAGPYLLCIWSKHESDVEAVMKLMEERYKHIVLPVQWSVISKTEFLNDSEGLKDKVKKLLEENPLFDAVLHWENRVASAARATTNTLFSLAQNVNQEGSIQGTLEKLQEILVAIGNEALGSKNAKEAPALAMDFGLAPILNDQLNSVMGEELNEKWNLALPSIGSREILDEETKSKLNSFYNIEVVPNDFPKNHRGVFVDLNSEYFQETGKIEKFESRIGRSINDLVHEEFIQRKGKKKSEERKLCEEACASTILGFLEVSAACDHAQRKTKLPKYILGALIPVEYEAFTNFKSSNGETKNKAHEGVFRLPNIDLNGNMYVVKFSFKYQFGAQPFDNKWFGKPWFRVRDQILASITFNSAQYASRPGIVSFG